MSTTEQRRFAQIVTDPVAYRSTDADDADILDNREAANSAFDGDPNYWLADPAPRPRPSWLGMQAVSDAMLGVVAISVVVALCAAFYGRALVEIVRGVMR